jgi:hypothetical protein
VVLHPNTYGSLGVNFHVTWTWVRSMLKNKLGLLMCRVVKASNRPTHPSVHHVRPLRNIRVYSSIFEHILKNIQRICQLRPIANRHVRPSCPYMTSLPPCLSFMTILLMWTKCGRCVCQPTAKWLCHSGPHQATFRPLLYPLWEPAPAYTWCHAAAPWASICQS